MKMINGGNNMKTIDVAKQFSPTPFGRYASDGNFSAEKFRDEILKPQLLNCNDDITVDFSKVALGVGSSFLEEVFGGLVRQGIDKRKLLTHIIVKDKFNLYQDQVNHFIKVANN